MSDNKKEVFFSMYCPKCRWKKTAEEDEPCCECLTYGALPYTHKPLKFMKGGGSIGRKDKARASKA